MKTVKLQCVHVAPWVPLPPMFGGRETILKLITREQVKQGQNPLIIGRLASNYKIPIMKQIDGTTYLILPVKSVRNIGTLALTLRDKLMLILDNLSMLVHMIPLLLSILRSRRNNIVIFYGFQFAPLALVTRFLGAPSLLGLSVFQSNHRKFSPKFFYRMILVRCFSAAFTYTKFFWKSKSEVIDNFYLFRVFLGEKAHFIPMGIDPTRFERIKPNPYLMELKLKSNYRLVVCPRRLVVEKGVHFLIEAIPHVLRHMKAKFVIIGEGPLKKFLTKKAQLLGVKEYVIFTGALPYDTCLSYIKAADVVVVPSSGEEAFGMVFVEAYALKKPIISTFFGGIPNVVKDKYTGMLVEPANSKQLARAIVTLLNSPKLRSKYVKNGYELVLSEFNISNIVKELTNILKKYAKKAE